MPLTMCTSLANGFSPGGPCGSFGATYPTTMPMFSYQDEICVSYTALSRMVSPGLIFTFQPSGAPVTVIEKSHDVGCPPARVGSAWFQFTESESKIGFCTPCRTRLT